MLKTIHNHRSIRKYKKLSINNDLLTKILEAGTRASTTGNMQVYSIIVNQKPELKQQLWEAHFKQNMVLEASATITFCADFNRFNQWCLQRNAKPGFDNFLSFFTAAIDALLVAQNVALAAEANNLGICYLGTTTYNAQKIIDILKLPKGVVPVTTLVVGHPNETPEITDRLPLNAVVHYESYNNYTELNINELYAEKEALQQNINLVETNKKENLAQIFTDNRYKHTDNVAFSKTLLQVLQNQGFMNQ